MHADSNKPDATQPVAWRYWNEKSRSWNTTTSAVVADAMRESGRTVESLYAAPQASEAVRDAEDAARWRWATATDENAEGLYTIVLCYGGDQQKINERADFYRPALSAQPAKEPANPNPCPATAQGTAAASGDSLTGKNKYGGAHD